MKNLSKISLFLCLLIFASLISCNQTKESVFKQKYHDLTAHYNAYFNAKEAFNLAYRNLLKNSDEDFTDILPLYAYGTPNDAKAYSSDFQRTIDKATIAIAEHEISKWSDNSFLLIGKSFYLQGDYNKSIETFQYITSEYQQGYKNEIMGKSSKSKSKKKKKRKKGKKKKRSRSSSNNAPESDESDYGLLEHVPSKYEALIWLSKSYVQQGKYKEAESILTYASADQEFPADLVGDLSRAKAFVKLEKADYSGSLASLQQLINTSSKKKEKARYNFIIGQVYTEIGNYSDAQLAFERCLNNQPNYKMAFYAKLNNAKLARLNGRSNDAIRAQLQKMSRDGKNEEFLDQIYYELAEIAMEDDNFETATEYLVRSVRASVNNDLQKGKSFLRLGELHYDVEMYTKSKLYYDSAVVLLPTDMEGYDLVAERKEILTNLVQQLDIIATQDSLQKLATLSENELRKIINKKISEKIAEEQSAKEEQAAAESGGPERLNDANSALAFNSGKGSWYFYNSSALSKGFNAFQSKWGKRKLEDNWRRKDKSSFESEEELVADISENEELQVDPSEYEKYLSNIPTDRQNLDASDKKVISALYTSGIIYKDDLENYKKAIQQFEELLSRYPGNEFKLETYYNLYLIHQELGNGGKQETYKNKILAEFPASKIAKIISDPSYASAIQSEDDEVNEFYKKTYALYEQGNYDEVIERNIKSRSQFINNDLQPKFEFLAALSIGQKGQMPKFEEALRNIVNKYPEDEVKSKAQEILMVLGGEQLPDPVIEEKEEEAIVDNNAAPEEEQAEEVAIVSDENMSEEEKMRKVFEEAIKNSKQESGGGFFGNIETDGENSQDGFGGFGDLSDEGEDEGDGSLFSFGGKETKKDNTAKGNKGKGNSGTKNQNNSSNNNNSANQNTTSNNTSGNNNNTSQNNSTSTQNNNSGQQNSGNTNSSNQNNTNTNSGNTNNQNNTNNSTGNTGNQNSNTANNSEDTGKPADQDPGNNTGSSTANNNSGNNTSGTTNSNNTGNSGNPGDVNNNTNTSGNSSSSNNTGTQSNNNTGSSSGNPSDNTSSNTEEIGDIINEVEEQSVDDTEIDPETTENTVTENSENPDVSAEQTATETPQENNNVVEEEAVALLEGTSEEATSEGTLNEEASAEFEEESTEEEESFFGISDNAPHYYVLQMAVEQDIESLKAELDRFNSANYNSLILRTTSMNLAGKKMLIAKKFRSANAANSYRLALEKDPAFSELLTGITYESYSISVLNYAILLGNKDFSKYIEFHSENY